MYTLFCDRRIEKVQNMKKLFLSIVTLIIIIPLNINAMPNVKQALSNVEFTSINGENIRINSYQGKIILLFFGYTNCPDICPTTLLDISKSLKELGQDAEKVQAIFVSVDYKRDTPKYLNEYVGYFDERIIGLTSNKKNIDKLNRYFKTTYALLDSNKKNYLVEHSSNLYVIDKNLIVKRIVANGLPSSEITKAVRKLIN